MKVFKQGLENSLSRNCAAENSQVGDNWLEFQVSSHPVTTSINITEYLLQKVYCPRPVMYTKTENWEKHTKISAAKEFVTNI